MIHTAIYVRGRVVSRVVLEADGMWKARFTGAYEKDDVWAEGPTLEGALRALAEAIDKNEEES